MAIEGSLADVSLADICQLLSLGRKTGCLTVTDRSNFGYVYFKKGRVIYASVLNRPDRLGEILVKNGVIRPEDLSKAMEHQGQEGQEKLGEILLGFGMVSSDDLQKWVTVQVEEAVYHLFSWNQGTFQFNPGELPDEGQVLLVTLNADGLLLEGARRVDEWSLVEKKIPSFDIVFQLDKHPDDSDEDREWIKSFQPGPPVDMRTSRGFQASADGGFLEAPARGREAPISLEAWVPSPELVLWEWPRLEDRVVEELD